MNPPLPEDAKTTLRLGATGRFVLEAAERRLQADGQPVALGGRAFDLLLALVARPDQLLSKNELLEAVWPGLVVEEANLQVQVANLRKVLGGDAIETVPGRGYRFKAAVGGGSGVPPASPPAPQTSPPASRLVGRSADAARLEALLHEGGCVTLVGTAGVGKTSLARAAAARWPGRSVWVDLAALVDGEQVAPAIARAVGRPLDGSDHATALRRVLQGEPLLVVLDNAEHVVDTCAEVIGSLRDLPDIGWLITSQLPLAVAAERVLRLEPLALDEPTDGDALGDSAVALLVERIVAADHRFQPTTALVPALRRICSRLDGLPLALEMAAARVPLLGLNGVHDALDERFALLTRGHRDAAPRHRTLHQALDWSYHLLAPAEQRLLRRLAVFAGGFSLELALALDDVPAAARWDVIDRLSVLVDRSLVVAGEGDPPRYRLLETVRAYGLEQLQRHGEDGPTRRSHALALRALFEGWTPGAAHAARCMAEMENARAAWTWALANDLALAAELATDAARGATFTLWRHETAQWMLAMEPALRSAAGAALPPLLQARWWAELARQLLMLLHVRARPVARHAVAVWRDLGEPGRGVGVLGTWVRSVQEPCPELDEACAALQAAAASTPDMTPSERLAMLGALTGAAERRGDHVAVLEGRLAEARLAEEAGWAASADAAGSNVVVALNSLGRHAEAIAYGESLLTRVQAHGTASELNLPWVLVGLLDACIGAGRLHEAAALVAPAHAASQRYNQPVLVWTLPLLAAAQHRFEDTARLIGHLHATVESLDLTADPYQRDRIQAIEQQMRSALGEQRTEALIVEGRMLEGSAAAALASGKG